VTGWLGKRCGLRTLGWRRWSGDARARAIANTAADGIIIFDGRGIIESFNPAAEPLFRYAAHEIVGRHVEILLPGLVRPPGERDAARDTVSFVAMGGEFSARRRDGVTFPVELTLSEMALRGGRIFTCVVRDITERKRLEEAEKLFMEAASHDVGNVLAAIAGYAMMVGDLATGDEGRMYVARITSLAHTLSAMMRDIVVHSGIGGAQRVAYSSLPLDTVLLACTKDVERDCARKGLRLRVAVPAGTTVVTDRAKLTRIVQNLLTNAVRYTETGEIELGAQVTRAEIRLHVRDTGIGIPAQDLPRVFEPYYRHDRAREMEQWGVGLGLATAKRLCELLGGAIDVDSAPDIGSEFRVRIPRERDTATPVASTSAAAPTPPAGEQGPAAANSA